MRLRGKLPLQHLRPLGNLVARVHIQWRPKLFSKRTKINAPASQTFSLINKWT